MTAVRALRADDHEDVVALSLRAWAPVFASMERVLGPSGVFAQLYPDWRAAQAEAVRRALAEAHVWVAHTADGVVTGFVAAVLHDDPGPGEVHMIAVDPPHQRRGVASALLTVATAWIAAQGRTMALVETGGDAGHAPARAVYERAGFTAMPVVRYFRRL